MLFWWFVGQHVIQHSQTMWYEGLKAAIKAGMENLFLFLNWHQMGRNKEQFCIDGESQINQVNL